MYKSVMEQSGLVIEKTTLGCYKCSRTLLGMKKQSLFLKCIIWNINI